MFEMLVVFTALTHPAPVPILQPGAVSEPAVTQPAPIRTSPQPARTSRAVAIASQAGTDGPVAGAPPARAHQ